MDAESSGGIGLPPLEMLWLGVKAYIKYISVRDLCSLIEYSVFVLAYEHLTRK